MSILLILLSPRPGCHKKGRHFLGNDGINTGKRTTEGGRSLGGQQRGPLTLGVRERRAWKEANREAEEKAPVDPCRGGRRHPPPPPEPEPEPGPTLGTAGAGAFLGIMRGIIRVNAWSLPRRSSTAATLPPIMARGGGEVACGGRSRRLVGV